MNEVQTPRRALGPTELVTLCLGVWTALSPFVLGFSDHIPAKWSDIAVGGALVLVALASGWADDVFEALVVPLGVWLYISGFMFAFSSLAYPVNNAGLALAVIATGAIGDGLRPPAVTKP